MLRSQGTRNWTQGSMFARQPSYTPDLGVSFISFCFWDRILLSSLGCLGKLGGCLFSVWCCWSWDLETYRCGTPSHWLSSPPPRSASFDYMYEELMPCLHSNVFIIEWLFHECLTCFSLNPTLVISVWHFGPTLSLCLVRGHGKSQEDWQKPFFLLQDDSW